MTNMGLFHFTLDWSLETGQTNTTIGSNVGTETIKKNRRKCMKI